MNDDLLPCPFCAGADLHQATRRVAGHGESFTYLSIRCLGCRASMEEGGYTGEDPGRFLASLRARWNRRAPTADTRRLEWCIKLLWTEYGLTTWLGAESEHDSSLGRDDPRAAIDRAIEAGKC